MRGVDPKVIGVVIAVLGGAAFWKSMHSGKMAPIINDVSTDLSSPGLLYQSKPNIPPLPESSKPVLRSFYADVQPLSLRGYSVAQVLELAAQVAGTMPRWDVRLRASGRLEGVATTALLRFRDDWALAAREDAPGNVRVDMRSRSRLGKGDMGVNAARIKAFLAALKARAGQGEGPAGGKADAGQ